MSQFPSLKPSARSLAVGQLPVTSFRSMSGKETRVLTGDTSHGDVIQLTFQHVQEPVVKQVLDHFSGQGSTLLSFTLPAAVWAGWDSYTDNYATDLKWRYQSAPTVAAVSPGIMTVSVELVSLA